MAYEAEVATAENELDKAYDELIATDELIAYEALVAYEADTAEPVATVTVNVEASPFVNVSILLVADAVVSNDAVDTVVPAFKANEAVIAKLAVVELNAYDALVAFVANELLVAVALYELDKAALLYDELMACEADVANEAVPNKLPVTPFPKVAEPVTSNEPVTITLPNNV